MRPQPDKIIGFMDLMVMHLGLPRYKIKFKTQPAGRDVYACLATSSVGYDAELYLGRKFDQLDDDEQRQTIVHEVLHLTHRRLDTVVDDLPMRDFDDRFSVETELMIDMWANFVADLAHVQRMWSEVVHDGIVSAA